MSILFGSLYLYKVLKKWKNCKIQDNVYQFRWGHNESTIRERIIAITSKEWDGKSKGERETKEICDDPYFNQYDTKEAKKIWR